jgi:hypothetical protein
LSAFVEASNASSYFFLAPLAIWPLTVDAAGAMPASFTATATSSDGATSELGAPVGLSE